MSLPGAPSILSALFSHVDGPRAARVEAQVSGVSFFELSGSMLPKGKMGAPS